MFKYVWFLCLVIAYVMAWLLCAAQVVEWVRRSRRIKWPAKFEYLGSFAQGWIITHITVLVLASFFVWVAGRIN